MINAGIAILPYDGQQTYNDMTQRWTNILVRVQYPADQSITNNPIAVDDVVIENNGHSWVIKARTLISSSTRQYRLDLERLDAATSADVAPAMGEVSRGAVLTPVKGFYVPHWDSTLVSAEISRIAAMLTAQKNQRENVEAASENTANTLVKRDESGNISANVVSADFVGQLTGNASTATKLTAARIFSLTQGVVSEAVPFDGSNHVVIPVSAIHASYLSGGVDMGTL